jgi:proteasome lid subunit RPN8/RPN11
MQQENNVPESILEQIRKICIATYPKESCGIVSSDRVIQSTNTASNPEKEFTIDPKIWASVNKVDFFWHSHTNDSELSYQDIYSAIALDTPIYLFSLPTGKEYLYRPGFVAPLLGREFVYWAADCWTVARDWYKLNWNIDIKDPPRELKNEEGIYFWDQDGWDMYQEILPESFDRMPEGKDLLRGDLILLTMRSETPTNVRTPNHVAVIDDVIKMEAIHHLMGQKSRKVVYGAEMRHYTHSIWRLRDVSKRETDGGNG